MVVHRELGIPTSYTLEASFCGAAMPVAETTQTTFYHFNTSHLMRIGASFCSALAHYFGLRVPGQRTLSASPPRTPGSPARTALLPASAAGAGAAAATALSRAGTTVASEGPSASGATGSTGDGSSGAADVRPAAPAVQAALAGSGVDGVMYDHVVVGEKSYPYVEGAANLIGMLKHAFRDQPAELKKIERFNAKLKWFLSLKYKLSAAMFFRMKSRL